MIELLGAVIIGCDVIAKRQTKLGLVYKVCTIQKSIENSDKVYKVYRKSKKVTKCIKKCTKLGLVYKYPSGILTHQLSSFLTNLTISHANNAWVKRLSAPVRAQESLRMWPACLVLQRTNLVPCR